jgi:hypothetical protein
MNRISFVLKMYEVFIRRFVECSRLYKINLTGFSTNHNIKVNSRFKFVIIRKSILYNFETFYSHNETKIDIINDRFNDPNLTCFAYFDLSENRIAYTRWLCEKEYNSSILKRLIILKPFEALTFDSFTHSDYRGIGLHRSMNIEMLNWLETHTGIRSVYMVIKCFYPHLSRVPKELGYMPLKTVLYLK